MTEHVREDHQTSLPLSLHNFESFVESTFIKFLQEHKLTGGSVSTGAGEKATVTMDKHGYYRVKYTKVKDNL